MKNLVALPFLIKTLSKYKRRQRKPLRSNRECTVPALVAALALFVCTAAAEEVSQTNQATLKEMQNSLTVEQANPTGEADDSILQKTIEAKERQKKNRIENWMRQASVAIKTHDYKTAESMYLQILSYDIPSSQRREVLLEMAKLFEISKEPAKQAAVLEKFGDTFPEDPGLPQVFIKAGILYRDMGLYKLALARFYSVLNYSLRIDQHRLEAYRQLSIRAQMEIADTHFAMAQYEEAIKFYSRLRLLNLPPEDRAQAIFQTAYCQYLLKNNPETIANLESFVRDYPDNSKIGEAMFLLANAYSRAQRHTEAAKTTLGLLKHEKEKNKDDEKQWIYWQKKAGNQLANDFFNQADYTAALPLYQAMIPLGVEPDWTWPLLYQMGVCYENLVMSPKAQGCYEQIINTPANNKTEALKNKSLASIYEMAQWRLENINWRDQTHTNLDKLLDKTAN